MKTKDVEKLRDEMAKYVAANDCEMQAPSLVLALCNDLLRERAALLKEPRKTTFECFNCDKEDEGYLVGVGCIEPPTEWLVNLRTVEGESFLEKFCSFECYLEYIEKTDDDG